MNYKIGETIKFYKNFMGSSSQTGTILKVLHKHLLVETRNTKNRNEVLKIKIDKKRVISGGISRKNNHVQ